MKAAMKDYLMLFLFVIQQLKLDSQSIMSLEKSPFRLGQRSDLIQDRQVYPCYFRKAMTDTDTRLKLSSGLKLEKKITAFQYHNVFAESRKAVKSDVYTQEQYSMP